MPEATFYLFPRSPVPDDEAFVRLLSDLGVLVMPGRIFETPGFFRICLTATMESDRGEPSPVRDGTDAGAARHVTT